MTLPRPTGPSPNSAIPILPSSFVPEPTQVDRLCSMPCEDVIDELIRQELKRKPDMEDEGESEVRVHFKSAPRGLVLALSGMCRVKSRSLRLVVKCLSHQGVAMLSRIDGLPELGRQYRALLLLHGRNGGLDDVCRMALTPLFTFSNSVPDTGFYYAARRLVATVSDLAGGAGVPVSALFGLALVLSLRTTLCPDVAGAVSSLGPEIQSFRSYVQDRAILMKAFSDIAERRLNITSSNSPAA